MAMDRSSASVPAISTPVGPPPTTTMVSSPLRPSERRGALELGEDPVPNGERVVEGVDGKAVLAGHRPLRSSSWWRPWRRSGSRTARLPPSSKLTSRASRSTPVTRPCRKRTPGVVLHVGPHRVGDVAGVEPSRRHLVEERLERVVVVPVDDGRAHRRPVQRSPPPRARRSRHRGRRR